MPDSEQRRHVLNQDVATELPREHLADNAVRQALSRIATSGPFVRSPQLISFLRFIVEEELSGRGERLKGYTIGVEAFSRGKDFDPNVDPIVRVEARRLRFALKSYYALEGSGDHIVIDLPVGSYRPTIKVLPVDQTLREPDRQGTAKPKRVLFRLHTTQRSRLRNRDTLLKLILAATVLNQIILWFLLLA